MINTRLISNSQANLHFKSKIKTYLKIFKGRESINTELDDLREFYDPDTVELMEWIE